MRAGWIVLACAALASPAAATDINLSVESGGGNTVTVAPGDIVNWSVVGELSDAANEGLAFFVLDVSFDGGDLTQADAPVGAPMNAFDMPNGLTNPAGFGGVVDDGDLIQVGGAQNTINNAFASAPIGAVNVGVAQPGAAESLVSGSLTAPIDAGTYTLSVSNVMANVIRQGETGTPFWAVDAAGVGTVTELTVIVESMTVDVETASIAGTGQQVMSLDAGDANAFRQYYILGSVTGTVPGFSFASGLHVPLNLDVYSSLLFDFANTLIFPQTGTLDFEGKATATFFVPPGTPGTLAGVTFLHAFVLLNPKDYVSNVTSLTLTP